MPIAKNLLHHFPQHSEVFYFLFSPELNLALHDEDPVRTSQGLALQALSGAHIDSTENAISMVDTVANADVATTASSLGYSLLYFVLSLIVFVRFVS